MAPSSASSLASNAYSLSATEKFAKECLSTIDTVFATRPNIAAGIRDATYLSGVLVEEDALPSTLLGLGLGIEKWVDFQGHVRSMNTTAAQIDSVLHKWLQHHLHKTNHHTQTDFIDLLISTFANQTHFCGHKRDNIIKATALTIMFTGTGSTSVTLTWALSLLLNHPNALKKAQEELDTQIGTHTWVQESDIKELHYLQAIIKETLRLYPPAPLTGIREAMQDCSLAGYHVPKGTRLLVNIWKIQRDPQIWSNPNEFQPERFLKDPHQHLEFKSGMNFEYIPFSFGRRSCPGMNFGLQVINLTLARLLQGFDMSVTEPVDMSEGLGLSLPKLNPLHLMLKPRLPLELYESL
ncbi:cytochrome P450 82G1-like [Senna tora]|uniref:Cytochrome P450 82G1-like n=1 Tax=Senna tora TaxID=362788 RepID=A0A835CMH2_9FABA|nr:cytochrome P450 82G1-like [Senna tora]